MKKIISLSAILISLTIVFIGLIITAVIYNLQSVPGTNTADGTDIFVFLLIFLSFFGMITTAFLLIKQSRISE